MEILACIMAFLGLVFLVLGVVLIANKDIVFGLAGILIAIILFYLSIYALDSAKMTEVKKEEWEEQGYSVLYTYNGFSNKEYPKVDRCINEEFKFVDYGYNEVDSLDEAGAVVCKLK